MSQPSVPSAFKPLAYLKDVLALPKKERQQVHSTLDLIPLSKNGLPVSALKQLQEKFQIGNKKMSELMGMSETTLQRRYRAKGRLSEIESQTVLQLAEIWSQGMYVFEDASDLRTWLSSELPALGGEVPLSLLGTPLGRQHVQELLLRLEWGIYS